MSRKSRAQVLLSRVVSLYPIFTRSFMKQKRQIFPGGQLLEATGSATLQSWVMQRSLPLTFEVIGKLVTKRAEVCVFLCSFSDGNQSDLIESCEALGNN